MKPSVFKQLSAVAVVGRELKPSPRIWNNSILEHKGKLWMSYRYHLKEEGGRCALAIVQLNEKFQPVGSSQHLAFSGPTGKEHHEDGRLFYFKGEPHISFTEMRGYIAGVDYTCVIRYARLKLRGNRWQICDVYQPRYGKNDGSAKEKNWAFFEYNGKLATVYSTGPEHVVVTLKGERVVDEFKTPGPKWPWGEPRGGTPPILLKDGTYLSIFHSSIAGEQPPNFSRYYGGAYLFDGEPPFTPIRVSTRPIMAGSEEDGHRVDPRYTAGWKPYVTFPCGLVERGEELICALGVNDWCAAIARIPKADLFLGAADGSDFEPRYFYSQNGSLPVSIIDTDMRAKQLDWNVPRSSAVGAAPGFMRCDNPREAQEVSEWNGVTEISEEEYHRGLRSRTALVFQ